MFNKIYINSNEKTSGDDYNGLYQISLPNVQDANGKDWGIAVQSFYSSSINDVPFTISSSIPLKSTYNGKEASKTLICLNSVNFHQQITSSTCDCILANTIQLYQNASIEINIKSTMFTNADLHFGDSDDGWHMTLVIYNII
jgi:hypothetical protein